MKTYTIQEWADSTGCYTAIEIDQENAMQRLHFFVNKPEIKKLGNLDISFWQDNKHYTVGTLTQDLFVPFDGDWEDSLHSPKEEQS